MNRLAHLFPIRETVLSSYRFVSGNLPTLMELGKGPAIVTLLISGLFGFGSGFQATPVFVVANVLGYGWFAFYVFRMVLLGTDKARVSAPPRSSGEGVAIRRSALGVFMGRALAMGAGSMAVFFLLTILITVPLALLDHAVTGQPARAYEQGYEVIDMLLISAMLFCLPVGIPLARYSPALAAAAIDRDMGFGLAWRASRGLGLRLTLVWIVLTAPFFFGYALLNAALSQVTGMTGGSPALAPSLVALVLITAIGMTVTALLSYATARAWLAIAGTEP